MGQKRIRDYGIEVGRMRPGKWNKITDVPGVLVGHSTIKTERNHTGVTVILPGPDNAYVRNYVAASYVHNGFGKSCGLIQVEELGALETPIALTNTLNVGLVWDALAEYVIRQCEKEGVVAKTINPVVGECNDSRINRICNRAVRAEHVWEAIECGQVDFAEGDVGAGAGTVCYGLKGGIGSASRVLEIYGREYTIGVLVQSNFGATEDFVLNGVLAGERILQWRAETEGSGGGKPQSEAGSCDDMMQRDTGAGAMSQLEKESVMAVSESDRGAVMAVSESDKGSVMTILATDLPVSDRQLKRILRRTAVGIARTGAYTGHGSGEVMIGFTTANRIPAKVGEGPVVQSVLHERLINQAFQAAAEAAHEAILNSMVCAGRTVGLDGQVFYGLGEILPEVMGQGR